MDGNPADKNLLYLMLGHQVFIEYLAGPRVTEDNFDQIVEQGEALTGQSEARTRAYYLRGISSQGIEVTATEERKNYVFISWGAVLRIWGPDRLELEQAEREAMGQDQQATEDIAVLPDRHEVMDLLANAETPSEAADAKVAADGWLQVNPSDGDVRMAREQLEDHFPEDTDTEEASPT